MPRFLQDSTGVATIYHGRSRATRSRTVKWKEQRLGVPLSANRAIRMLVVYRAEQDNQERFLESLMAGIEERMILAEGDCSLLDAFFFSTSMLFHSSMS